MSPSRFAFPLGVVILSACSHDDIALEPRGLDIRIAPLNLPAIGKVCFDVTVYDAAGGASGGGQVVWSAGTPGADGDEASGALCSSTFGNGAGGDIGFVGTCDAGPSGSRTNSVTLVVDGLYDASNAYIAPGSAQGWQNPCSDEDGGCTLDVVCRANSDALVQFDLTILRQANQGFFDVAVTFDDIFCSAKVDCTDPLVIAPATNARVPSVVFALACTDGDPAASDATATHLYLDPITLRCGDDDYVVEPWRGPGNLYSTTSPPPVPFPWLQAMTFTSVTSEESNGQSADVLAWSAAMGIDPSFFAGLAPGTSCSLVTRATASHGPLDDGETAGNYPYIDVDVRIYDGGFVCSEHPLNGSGEHAGVRTTYSGMSAPIVFKSSGQNVGGTLVTAALASCGNGTRDAGEACDAGALNGTTTCGCKSDCTYPFWDVVCTNGTCDGSGGCLPAAEPLCPSVEPCVQWSPAPECAPIPLTGNPCFCGFGSSCVCSSGQCVPANPCGNGTLDEGEQCDAGGSNGTTTCGCKSDCTYPIWDVVCPGGVCDGFGGCLPAAAPECPPSDACAQWTAAPECAPVFTDGNPCFCEPGVPCVCSGGHCVLP